jgi:hypothetical protein
MSGCLNEQQYKTFNAALRKSLNLERGQQHDAATAFESLCRGSPRLRQAFAVRFEQTPCCPECKTPCGQIMSTRTAGLYLQAPTQPEQPIGSLAYVLGASTSVDTCSEEAGSEGQAVCQNEDCALRTRPIRASGFSPDLTEGPATALAVFIDYPRKQDGSLLHPSAAQVVVDLNTPVELLIEGKVQRFRVLGTQMHFGDQASSGHYRAYATAPGKARTHSTPGREWYKLRTEDSDVQGPAPRTPLPAAGRHRLLILAKWKDEPPTLDTPPTTPQAKRSPSSGIKRQLPASRGKGGTPVAKRPSRTPRVDNESSSSGDMSTSETDHEVGGGPTTKDAENANFNPDDFSANAEQEAEKRRPKGSIAAQPVLNAFEPSTRVHCIVMAVTGAGELVRTRDGRVIPNKPILRKAIPSHLDARIITTKVSGTGKHAQKLRTLLVLSFASLPAKNAVRLACIRDLRSHRTDGAFGHGVRAPFEHYTSMDLLQGGAKKGEREDRLRLTVTARTGADAIALARGLAQSTLSKVTGSSTLSNLFLWSEPMSASATKTLPKWKEFPTAQPKPGETAFSVVCVMFGKSEALQVAKAAQAKGIGVHGEIPELCQCRNCGMLGHSQKDCPQNGFVLRIDSHSPINPGQVKQMKDATNASRAYQGAWEGSWGSRWKNFGHLHFPDLDAMREAAITLRLSFSVDAPTGERTVTAVFPSVTGVPPCCGACGHRKGTGGLVDHKAGDEGCPHNPKFAWTPPVDDTPSDHVRSVRWYERKRSANSTGLRNSGFFGVGEMCEQFAKLSTGSTPRNTPSANVPTPIATAEEMPNQPQAL